ncbi:MAG: flavin reductase family protein [Nitrososphaerota archaeon]|uniref:flavin reductase family protein n=1 Tax=Candidatus Bathycorpusculum sp. TaxID=2994959 RepID=UPI002825A5FD|nr:flavin reductase family protein [Candidatus Termiticorpusculum sp.]MCL2257380.1 flavin reductase family protein [Candidatus Termiticorpusculum sp.]MCL2292521.1 flavin reductase family protein [Candidatus Termiticorpusculum sp.]MDR0460706.1 flavin reductase family protein [Nitrososphaerota archaeon]
MEKVSLGKNGMMFPMSLGIIGVNVTHNQPNFTTVSSIATASLDPPLVSFSLNKVRFSNKFIIEKKTFSVNFPSASIIDKVDYCGLVSGENIDKSQIFQTFYGTLSDTPMIKECPLCLECKLVAVIDLPKNELFIGQIVNAYSEQKYLTNGKLDTTKLGLCTLNFADSSYRVPGAIAGKAFCDGAKLAPLS